MCLAKAFAGEKGEELIMEDVSRLIIEGGRLRLTTLFGERKDIDGTLQMVDFQGGRIVIGPPQQR